MENKENKKNKDTLGNTAHFDDAVNEIKTNEAEEVSVSVTISEPIKSLPVKKHADNTNKKKVKVKTVKDKNRKPFPFAIVFTGFLVTIMMLFLILNYAELNKYNQEVAQMKNEINALMEESTKLKSNLAKREDFLYIEEYASEKLGLVAYDTFDEEYVATAKEDFTESNTYEDEETNSFGLMLSGIARAASRFFE